MKYLYSPSCFFGLALMRPPYDMNASDMNYAVANAKIAVEECTLVALRAYYVATNQPEKVKAVDTDLFFLNDHAYDVYCEYVTEGMELAIAQEDAYAEFHAEQWAATCDLPF